MFDEELAALEANDPERSCGALGCFADLIGIFVTSADASAVQALLPLLEDADARVR